MLYDLENKGYSIDYCLSKSDLNFLRNIINKHYIDTIVSYYPNYKNLMKSKQIYEYHKISDNFDHSKLWSKKNRIIPQDLLIKFKKINFLKKIKKFFGDFTISNEEFSKYEEVYWRIARPKNKDDIGTLHADKWFWKDDKNAISKRIKVWIPVYCNGKNTGFCYVPKSHLKNIKYKSRKEKNRTKFIIENTQDLKIKKHIANPGNAIIFHDNLIHGGYSIDNLTRVSIEFTMIIKD